MYVLSSRLTRFIFEKYVSKTVSKLKIGLEIFPILMNQGGNSTVMLLRCLSTSLCLEDRFHNFLGPHENEVWNVFQENWPAWRTSKSCRTPVNRNRRAPWCSWDLYLHKCRFWCKYLLALGFTSFIFEKYFSEFFRLLKNLSKVKIGLDFFSILMNQGENSTVMLLRSLSTSLCYSGSIS
jgi:hypothetical protein